MEDDKLQRIFFTRLLLNSSKKKSYKNVSILKEPVNRCCLHIYAAHLHCWLKEEHLVVTLLLLLLLLLFLL